MDSAAFALERSGSNDFGPCACCGNISRTVWGYLNCEGGTAAVYYVHWTLGRVDHGASFDVITGDFDEGICAKDRSLIAVRFRLVDGEPQFMVVDAEDSARAKGKLASTALRRDQVIGTPLAKEVFAMIDTIWLDDDRIRELTGRQE